MRVVAITDGTPQEIGAALAKYSRSNKCIEDLISICRGEKAAEFHEKWVEDFGDDSVRQLACGYFAIEDVSQLIAKLLEDRRIGGWSERSTRFQVFKREGCYLPEIYYVNNYDKSKCDALKERINKFYDRVFEVYHIILNRVQQFYVDSKEIPEGMSDKEYQGKIRSRACDVARYVLPMSLKTNVGCAISSQTLMHTICHLLDSPLPEAQQVGHQLKAEGLKVFPNLLKHAHSNNYWRRLTDYLTRKNIQLFSDTRDIKYKFLSRKKMYTELDVKMIECHEALLEDRIIAQLLFPYNVFGLRYNEILAYVVNYMSDNDKNEIFTVCNKNREFYDKLTRQFENSEIVFDVLMDIGAWRDIHRHRMWTQLRGIYTTGVGYVTPPEIYATALNEYNEVMKEADVIFGEILDIHVSDSYNLHNLHTAAYVIPMGYLFPSMYGTNVRQLEFVTYLRSGPGGHFAYRDIVHQMHDCFKVKHPKLAELFRIRQIKEEDFFNR